MAVVAVTADNVRVAVATIATDTGTWGNDGGGGGVADEPDIVYQGNEAQSRKVSTQRIGRSYTHGSGTDLTATDRRHWIAKIAATNYAALVARTTPALGTKMGSGSGAYYEHYLFGNDNYPPLGGWQIVAISPNVAGYRDATTGSPTLTSVLYWSILGDFSSTSKAENVVSDAIDIGAGLHLVGGDGADPDGAFQNFVTTDEGTVNNRWGYVTTRGPVLYVIGRLAIGRNTSDTAVATVFQDSGVTLVWDNGLVETGFHEVLFDLGQATTDIDLTACVLISTGEKDNTAGRGYTTTEDSRTVLTVVGTAGALDLIGCSVQNFASVVLTAAATLLNTTVEMETLTQSTAELDGCTLKTTSVSGAGTMTNPVFGASGLHDSTFEQAGAGHAVVFTTPGTHSVIGITGWNAAGGYGAAGSNAAGIYNNSGGLITLNLSGGSATPTVRNGTGASTVVNNNVNVTFTGMKDNTEVRVYDAGTGAEIAGVENATDGTPDNRSFTWSDAAANVVNYIIHSVDYEHIRVENYTVPSSAVSIPIQQRIDRNYANV